MSADIYVTVAWFDTAIPTGRPALGCPESLLWSDFCGIVTYWRREGDKDGCCFVPARFALEANGKDVRRLARNVLARTMPVLDVECSKVTGEIPPDLNVAVKRIEALGLAGVAWTTHHHTTALPRYRISIPLTEEVDPILPVCEIVAQWLGLGGVLDQSKIGPASAFYLPSRPDEADDEIHDLHKAVALDGDPICADRLRQAAGSLLATHRAEAERIAALGMAEAAVRREAKIAAGFDPADSLIDRIRTHLDLTDILRSYGYDQAGGLWRHPQSSSGVFGLNVKTFGGLDRAFSHNASDPLHSSNLPAWCDVTAVDAFDVACILQFGGDRDRAFRELGERFGLTKAAARKSLSRLLFNLIRQRTSPTELDHQAKTEGIRLGLTAEEINSVKKWVSEQGVTVTGRAA